MRKIIILVLLAFLPFYVAAQVTVSGVIRDNDRIPMPEASVMEAGNTTNMVFTNAEGKFTITLKSDKAKITVNFMGFREKTFTPKVSGSNIIDLELDETMLEAVEIVRMGFGTTTRISNVAAISQAGAKIIERSSSTSVQNSLAGRIPGLFQLQGSGQPGNDAAEVFIRGVSTFTGQSVSPLIMIDDIESDLTTLNQMTPNEIEDVSVLKDAASTAIFGIKGANGVILVTTKRGNVGPARVTFKADIGLKRPTYKNKFLNSYESLSLIREMHVNDNNFTELANDRLYSAEALEHYRLGDEPYLYPDVDWYNLMYKNLSLQQKYSVDIRGGTDKVGYFLNLGYLDNGGLFKEMPKPEKFNNDYYEKRYNIRSNFDIKVNKRFTVKLNASGVLSEQNEPYLPSPRESGTFSIFRRLLGGRFSPWNYPAYNPDGSFGGLTGTSANPLALLTQTGYSRNFRNSVSGNITLDHKLDFITEGLKISGLMAATNNWGWKRDLTRSGDRAVLDFQVDDQGNYKPVMADHYTLDPLKVASSSIEPFLMMNTRVNLDYSRKFGRHNVNGLVLASWTADRRGSQTPSNSINYSTRLGYDYDERYLFTFSLSYNGSDRFSKNNRYDYFPSVGAGWNLAREPYMKDALKSVGITFLKIRGSYGISGSDNIPGYGYLETYKQDFNYFFGTTPTETKAMVLQMLANPNVRWEKETKFGVGVDFRAFNERLGGSIDYFFNKRDDILAKRSSIVIYAGFPPEVLPFMNLGKTQNKGWDGSITWSDKIGKDFKYSVTAIASYAKNKILDMDEAPSEYVLSRQTGGEIGTSFGFLSNGFYNTQEEIDFGPYDQQRGGKPKLGDIRYQDISGPNGMPDRVIDEYDRVPIGNSRPNFNYSFNFEFSYKGFDISTYFQGATGASLTIENMLRIGSTDGRPIPLHNSRWTHFDREGVQVTDPKQLADMNRGARFPVLSKDNGNNKDASSFWRRSTDYLKWKSVMVGYTFPKEWFHKVGIQSLRIYFSGDNLHTWSQIMKDFQVDPESSRTSQYNATSHGPLDTYPQQRIYNFGCQIVF